MTTPDQKPKRRRGPESEFYDHCKGQRVVVQRSDTEGLLRGSLIWVDVYTIGIRQDDKPNITLVNKSIIATIDRDEQHGQREGGRFQNPPRIGGGDSRGG